jgi:hypothetical protein
MSWKMFNFLKKKNNMSKVRIWAEAQKKADQKEEPIKILSDATIYGLSRFCISEKDVKKKDDFVYKVAEKVRIDYGGDASLFEVGCYLYFRIDLWHVQNKMQKYRDKVVGYLIKQFLSVFKNSLGLENIEEIFQNRLNLYGKLVREIKDPVDRVERFYFYLTQLLIRTKDNMLPLIYDFKNFPLFLIGIVEQTCLEIKIRGFEVGMVPACLKCIENFYKLTSEENK